MPDEIEPDDVAAAMGADKAKINFDIFHPIDHWPYSARCRSFPGGGRRHLRDTWEFRRRDQVVGWFRRPTSCLIGRHVWQVWKRGSLDTVREIRQPSDYTAICRYCSASRLATEDEWW